MLNLVDIGIVLVCIFTSFLVYVDVTTSWIGPTLLGVRYVVQTVRLLIMLKK